MRLFEISNMALRCTSCRESVYSADDLRGHDYYCVNCYENPYCLVTGCNDEHRDDWATEGPDSQGQWQCPEFGTYFTYCGPSRDWDNSHNWYESDQYTYSVEIDGYWYDSDEVYSCERCDTTIHSDDTYSDGDGTVFCRDCYEEWYDREQSERDDGYYEDDDDEDNGRDYNRRNGGRHYTSPRCSRCNEESALTHYHLNTEEVYCAECAVIASREYPGKVKPINESLFTEEDEAA